MKFWNGSKSYKRSNLENLCLMACGCNKYSGVATKKAPSLKPAHYWGMATIRDRKVYPMRPNAMCCAIWVKCCTFHFLWSSCTKSASVWPTYVRNQNRKYSKNHIDECETKISPNVIEWILFLFFSFFCIMCICTIDDFVCDKVHVLSSIEWCIDIRHTICNSTTNCEMDYDLHTQHEWRNNCFGDTTTANKIW